MFKTPDITPAQIVAVVGAVIAVLVAFGVDLSKEQVDAVIQAVAVIAGVLIAGDAVVRHGRATGNARKEWL
jgi:multisubunit Na+/H+ antiporter MnhB subunit